MYSHYIHSQKNKKKLSIKVLGKEKKTSVCFLVFIGAIPVNTCSSCFG